MNSLRTIFLSLIFRIWIPQVRLFFDLKVLWIAQKVHLGGNRRLLSLFIRFKQILTLERQTCKPDRYRSSRRPPARISEENLEKYQDLKRELKRIWKCKEALGALWMESTNLRKWLQVLDVAKELEFGYRSYSSSEQLACGHIRISRSSLLSTHFGEEKRRPEMRLCPQAREQQWSLKEYWTWDNSQQQKSRNITRYIIKSRNITLIIFASGTIPLQ